MWPPTGDETVSRPLVRLSASAATTPMTIRAAPESRKPVLTPTLSMTVVAMRGAIAMAPAMPASHRPRALARWRSGIRCWTSATSGMSVRAEAKLVMASRAAASRGLVARPRGKRKAPRSTHASTAVRAKYFLGYARNGPPGGPYQGLVPASGQGIEVLLQRVPEAKGGKNRVHLDLRTADLDAEVIRGVALGARRLTSKPVTEGGWRWHILADPDGNE